MSLDKEFSVALYKSIAEANEHREYRHWHASSISDCPRAHYFKRLGISALSKPSGAKVIRWGAGHKLEAELREHIAKVWGGTTSNTRYTSEVLDLTGEFDNLTVLGDTLVEVKSVSDWAFITRNGQTTLKKATGQKTKWGKDEFEPMYEPYRPHVYQNHAYVLLLDENKIKVKNIDYVYVSLSGLLCVYKTEVSSESLQWVKTRLESLNKAWKAKKLPPCFCDPKSELWGPVYQWCNYRDGDKCCKEGLADDIQTS